MQAARNIILKHDDNCCSSSNFYDIKKFCCYAYGFLYFPTQPDAVVIFYPRWLAELDKLAWLPQMRYSVELLGNMMGL